MLRLVLNGIGARRAQSLAALMLCALAVAAAAAAPIYVHTAYRIAIHDEISAAPVAAHILSVSEETSIDGSAKSAMDDLGTSVDQALPVRLGDRVAGIATFVDLTVGGAIVPTQMAYREGLCARVVVTGACPTEPNQIIVTARAATMLGIAIGSRVTATTSSGNLTLIVTGEYQRVNPADDYWVTPLFNAPGVASLATDTILTSPETMAQARIPTVTVVEDIMLPESVFADNTQLTQQLTHAATTLAETKMTVSASAGALAATVAQDQGLVRTGVVVPLLQLLAICWLALFLAARHAAEERRGDTGLLKLRGSSRWTLLRLSIGQGVASMAAGLIIGVLGAYLASRWWSALADASSRTWELSALTVAATLAGAMIAIVLADWRTAKAPVADLLRRVPPRRRGIRTDVGDVVIVVLAATAAFQSWVDTQSSFVVTLAPALVALSVVLIIARVLLPVGEWVGAAALRTGRLRLAVGALQVARRPGIDRVFVLLAISAALLSTAALSWSAAASTRADRATIDLGADRVLTVTAPSALNLLRVVRDVDPGGRIAMAAAVLPSNRAATSTTETAVTGPIIAVDSTRFASVAAWSRAYPSLNPAKIAAALHTPSVAPLLVNGSSLSLDETTSLDPTRREPLYLVVHLANEMTGASFDVFYGQLAAGHAVLSQKLRGCATTACRLTSIQLIGRPTTLGTYTCPPLCPPVGAHVVIQGLRTPEAAVADAAVLGDVNRWRSVVAEGGMGLSISHTSGTLTLGVDDGMPADQVMDYGAFVAAGPLPLPAVQAGASTTDLAITGGRVNSFNGEPVPIQIVDVAPILPAIGGHGIMVDLESLERITTDPGVDKLQVWLAPGAPESIITKLSAAGLTVIDDDSIAADRARLAQEGPASALTFQLLTGAIGVLLAMTAFVAAASAERTARSKELGVMRMQGLPARVAAAIGYGGYGALVVAAVGCGLVATSLARVLVRVRTPIFVDTWSLIPVDRGVSAAPLLVTTAVAAIIFGAAALMAARSLTRTYVSRLRVSAPHTSRPRSR